MVDVVLTAPLRLARDDVLRLPLGPDEEHLAALCDLLLEIRKSVVPGDLGLLQIDDVDAVATPEDERLHLGVPPTGLVTEVDAGFEQLPQRYADHVVP